MNCRTPLQGPMKQKIRCALSGPILLSFVGLPVILAHAERPPLTHPEGLTALGRAGSERPACGNDNAAGDPHAAKTRPVPDRRAVPIADVTLIDREKGFVSSALLAARPRSARDILLEARLDEHLAQRIDELAADVGEADGRLLLNDFITVLNGESLVAFVTRHGYASFAGPTAVRRFSPKHMEIEVEIHAPGGEKMTAILHSDGTFQGRG